MLKRIMAGLLVLVWLISGAVFADETVANIKEQTEGLFQVKQVEVIRDGAVDQQAIKPGDVVGLRLELTSSLPDEALSDIGRLKLVQERDSFPAIKPAELSRLSIKGQPLRLQVFFPEVKYTGQAKELVFRLSGHMDEPLDERHRVEIKPAQPAAPDTSPQTPVQPPVMAAPQVVTGLKADPGILEPGQTVELRLVLQNVGPAAVERPVLRVRGSDSLTVAADSASRLVGDIPPGKTVEVPVRFQVADEPAAAKQSLGLSLSFQYDSGQGRRISSSEDRIEFALKLAVEETTPAEPPHADPAPPADDSPGGWSGPDYAPSGSATPTIDQAVPNVLIKQFRYGDKPIAAGQSFDLKLDIINTSAKLAVENIVMSLEPGEGFALDGASNVAHFTSLAASGNLTQNIKLKALPGAKSGSNAIEVSFRYEYLDNDKRSQASLTQKLAIPVYQPDRLEISPPGLPETVEAGQEVVLNLDYVNKGRGDIANVEALIEGEVTTVAKQQNLGNFEPGKSGTISFLITPDQPGELKLTLKVNYEDANQTVQTKQFPVTLNVSPSAPLPEEEDVSDLEPVAESSGRSYWLMGAGGLALSLIGLVVWRRRKQAAADDIAWPDDDRPESIS